MMKQFRRRIAFATRFFLACLVMDAGSAFGQDRNDADREGDARCRHINARLASAIVTDNCTSPVGLCAAGVVTGNGLIQGTTFATALGIAPSMGLPGIEPATTLSVAGERTISTARGVLTFRLLTVFDTARGEAAELNAVTGGTGKFDGATGTLWLMGTGTTVFEGQLTGVICLNRP